MKTTEHIDYGRSGASGSDQRMDTLIEALKLTLSPIDLISIISLIDHKGTLEVILDQDLVYYLNSKTKNNQQVFIEKTIRDAWDILGEPNCEFKYYKSDNS